MKHPFRFVFFSAVCLGFASMAATVNPAPNFVWDSAGGKVNSLKALRGSSVILLIARSPKEKAFLEEVKKMKELYEDFAARKVVCATAFLENPDARIPSDIPFLVASNGPQVIADYGVKDSFNVIVIGPDGNIDMQTNQVCAAARLRDVVMNNFAVQSEQRK